MMFPVAKPDKFLDRQEEPAMDFETWMGLFESYMDACLLQGAYDASMMGVFKISLGPEGYKILRSRPNQCGTLDEMIQSIKQYYNPEQSIGRCRCYLKCASQQPGESVSEFGGRIRNTPGRRSCISWKMS